MKQAESRRSETSLTHGSKAAEKFTGFQCWTPLTSVWISVSGMRRVGRRPEQQGQASSQHQGGQGEARPGVPAVPVGDKPSRGRGGGRGARGGRGRGMGRGDGFDSRGKRDFDRHSGNDKSRQKGEEKRGGSGLHNWGNVKEEASELDQSAAPEPVPEGEDHAPADSENKENEVEEVKDEGPKEMTLDEWKAMQDKERSKVEFNIRKPNEGNDSQWKKGYVLHKSKSEEVGTRQAGPVIETGDVDPDSFHKADEGGDHHFRKPANDITSQLEINFGDLGRPGRGRGGSRGGRGGRGGGGGGGGVGGGGVSVPNVDDPEAFPALA
uniref:Plasminogen activator inhibitor 1 RNA-binding protein-like n=1 Tax=Sinocyclocheilus anshuiensis TaxID=1608454 RepID=A0A671KW10_9TELE